MQSTKLLTLVGEVRYWSLSILVGAIFGFGLQYAQAAWSEPPAATVPPSNNVGAPLNTSGIAQVKDGGLGLNILGAPGSNALLIPNGRVGIGTNSPGAGGNNPGSMLDVYRSNGAWQSGAGIRARNGAASSREIVEAASDSTRAAVIAFGSQADVNAAGTSSTGGLWVPGDSRGMGFYNDSNNPTRFLIGGQSAGSEKMRVTADGKVGIGTTNPGAGGNNAGTMLDVVRDNGAASSGAGIRAMNTSSTGREVVEAASNSTRAALIAFGSNFPTPGTSNTGGLWVSGSSSGMGLYNDSANPTRFHVGGQDNEKMRITADGKVGIGTTSPGYTLDVNGVIRATNVAPTSDIRLKENVAALTNSVNSISQLRGVSFDWKKDHRSDLGLIAQEVEKVYPQLVFTDKEGIKSLNYNGLVAPLVEAVKTLKAQNDELKNMNADMLRRIEALEKR